MVLKFWIQRFVSQNQPLLPGVVAVVVSLGLGQVGVWQPLERLGYNTLFQIRAKSFLPQPHWDERVAVIAIDEASLQKYGRFPWKRDRYVQLLQALEKSPPAAIGFDILFVESSPNDQKLAAAMAMNGRVVLAKAWDDQNQPLDPVPILAAATSTGHISHQTDPDGTSRRAIAYVFNQPSLALAMLKLYNTNNPSHPVPLPQPVADQEWQEVWINWSGQRQQARTYSFADVVEGRVPAKTFANKFVLVGTTAVGLDPLVTPFNFSPPTSGVYLHAAVINNLLGSHLLQPLPEWGAILLLLLLGPLTSRLLSKRTPRGRIALAVLLPAAWLALTLAAFTGYWWLPTAAPVCTILLAWAGVQVLSQYEKQQLMSLFAKHVAPEMANLIWQNKTEIFEHGELQAQELTATVLFMDIRSFTTISEYLTPRELLGWLNQYLEAMTDCIMDHDGVIDKYIGDAIMAVFGVPFPHTDSEGIRQDALNAIAASIAMHERLQQLNRRFKAEGKPMIEFGIGIHTGLVIAGSVGGARRLNYSVLGDTVNIAARLESMNKTVKANNRYNLLVSSETYAHVNEHYHGEPVGKINLRGRKQTTVIYSISGEKVTLDQLSHFNESL